MVVALLFLQHACITYDADHVSQFTGNHFDGALRQDISRPRTMKRGGVEGEAGVEIGMESVGDLV